MRFRKLRIAWSVCCAIACVLLIALWERSYSWSDGLRWEHGAARDVIIIKSETGVIVLGSFVSMNPGGQPNPGVTREQFPVFIRQEVPWFNWKSDAEGTAVVFPIGLLVALMAVLCIVPWIRHFIRRGNKSAARH
jgi:hypothetical protein